MSDNLNNNVFNQDNAEEFDGEAKVAQKEAPRKKKGYMSNKYFLWGLTGFLTVIACIAVYFVLHGLPVIFQFIKSVNKVLMPVYMGMIIAYILTPLLNFIECKLVKPLFNKSKFKPSEKRDKFIRGLCIFITIIITLALIFWMFYLMISQIVPSVTSIIQNFDSYTDNFQLWITKTLENNDSLRETVLSIVGGSSEDLEKWLNGDIWSFVSKFVPFINSEGNIEWSQVFEILSTIIGNVGKVFTVVWNFIIGFIIAMYLMGGKEKFAGRAKKLTFVIFKRKVANEIIRDVRFTHKTFIGFLGGKIVDSIIVGLLCFIGTSILHTPYAGLVSLFVGVTNIIPYFGPFIGAIPSAILIFVVDPMHPLNMIFFVIFILVLQQLDGNVIGPKILGDSTGLEGFWVIFSITLFGGFFGVPGMIIGVPLFAVFYAGIKGLARKILIKKKLPRHTKDYVDIISIDEEGNIEEFVDEAKQPFKKNKDGKSSVRIPFITSIIEKIKNKKKDK